MKRFIIIFLAFLILFGLFGCSNKQLSIEESQKNFLQYKDALQAGAKRYGFELLEKNDPSIEDQKRYMDLYVPISEYEQINIRLINSATDTNKGVESFSVEYILDSKNAKEGINVDLFVVLVNCVSGKKITNEFCKEFLDAPESQYDAKKYGFLKLNGEKICKWQPLNFFEDWTIIYTMDKNDVETLSFGGLTPAGQGDG